MVLSKLWSCYDIGQFANRPESPFLQNLRKMKILLQQQTNVLEVLEEQQYLEFFQFCPTQRSLHCVVNQ